MAEDARASRHVVFVGAMGSGKTTIGRRVAGALGLPFLDNDELLERSTGESAVAIADRDGIDGLHRVEAAIVLDALRAPRPSVIAAAASTVTDAAVRLSLRRSAWVAWLRADPSTLVERLPNSPTRPFREVDPARLVEEQARRRDARFAELADAVFETDRADVDRVVTCVLASVGESGSRV